MLRKILHDMLCMVLGAVLFGAMVAMASDDYLNSPFVEQMKKAFVTRINAVVVNDIRSSDYIPGLSGWRIWSDGTGKSFGEFDGWISRPQPLAMADDPRFKFSGMNILMENPIQFGYTDNTLRQEFQTLLLAYWEHQ